MGTPLGSCAQVPQMAPNRTVSPGLWGMPADPVMAAPRWVLPTEGRLGFCALAPQDWPSHGTER